MSCGRPSHVRRPRHHLRHRTRSNPPSEIRGLVMHRLVVPFVALVALVAVVSLAAPAAAKSQSVPVKLTADGCPKLITVKPGSVTFKVTNDGADNVSEFEVMK